MTKDTSEVTKPITDQDEITTNQHAPDAPDAPANEPQHNGYDAPASYNSNKEWEEDRRSLAKARHDALNGFLQASVIQRTNLLRDMLAVSVTTLLGALTLYFASGPSHDGGIKSQWMFFAGLIVLTLGTAVNLLARSEIIRHLQQISHQIELNYLQLFEASRSVMRQPSQFNIDTAYRVEGAHVEFAKLAWIGEHGHRVAIWSLLICVLLLSLSLIFNISL